MPSNDTLVQIATRFVGHEVRELGSNGHAIASEAEGVSVVTAPEGAGVCGGRTQAVVSENGGFSQTNR